MAKVKETPEQKARRAYHATTAPIVATLEGCLRTNYGNHHDGHRAHQALLLDAIHAVRKADLKVY